MLEDLTEYLEPINDGLDPKVYAWIIENVRKSMFARQMGIRITRLVLGKAYVELVPDILHTNLGGFLHGGVSATLADVSMGIACFTTGVICVTANMNISYLATGQIGQKITAVGQVIRSGKNVLFTESSLENEQGKLIAKATATFLEKGLILK